jgi:hypothetical protein
MKRKTELLSAPLNGATHAKRPAGLMVVGLKKWQASGNVDGV